MDIRPAPVPSGAEITTALDFGRLGRLFGQLAQHVTVFGIKRKPDGIGQLLCPQLELFGGSAACLTDFSDDVQSAQQAGDQKGRQGKDGEEFELKAGSEV